MSAVHEAFQGLDEPQSHSESTDGQLWRPREDAASALGDGGPCQNGKNIVGALFRVVEDGPPSEPLRGRVWETLRRFPF